MSRNLRTGYNYQCFSDGQDLGFATLGAPRSCVSGWAVAFEAATGNKDSYSDQWVYYILDGKIFKSIDGMVAPIQIQLTSNEIVIDQVSDFSILGAEPPSGNTQQPLITIKLVGTITTKNAVTPFSLQTSVSQRLLDI